MKKRVVIPFDLDDQLREIRQKQEDHENRLKAVEARGQGGP